jgi:rubrerythrin
MEDSVNDYFLVAKFKKCYERMIETLEDRSSWPKVDIAVDMAAPLSKRPVGQQRKNRYKGFLEGGSGKKATDKDIEKARKIICDKYKCPNCGALGHRKNSPKCPLNGTKKRQVEDINPNCQLFVFA